MTSRLKTFLYFAFALSLAAQYSNAGDTTNSVPGTTGGTAKVTVTTDAAGAVTAVKVELPDIAAKNGGVAPVINLTKVSSGSSADGKLCTEAWCGKYVDATGKAVVFKTCIGPDVVSYAGFFKVILNRSKDKDAVTTAGAGQVVTFSSTTGFVQVPPNGQPPQPPATSGPGIPRLDPPGDTDPDFNLQWQPGADCIAGTLDIPGTAYSGTATGVCKAQRKCFSTYLYAKKAGDKDKDTRTVWAVVNWGFDLTVCVAPDSITCTPKVTETIPSDLPGEGGAAPDKNKDIDDEMKTLDDQLKGLNKKTGGKFKADTYKSEKNKK